MRIRGASQLNIRKRIFVFSSIVVLLVLVFLPVIESSTIPITVNDRKSVVGIESDSFYDYGVKAGQQFLFLFQALDRCVGQEITKKINSSEITEQMMLLQKESPTFINELKGLSESTNIRIERLLLLQHSFFSWFGGECTTTLSTGNATKNNQTFLTQNFDVVRDFSPRVIWTMFFFKCIFKTWFVVHIRPLKYAYACWGIPILYEVPALNEKGLGFGGNGLRLTKDTNRTIDEGQGMATYLLERQTMRECQNVSEVAALWKETERAFGNNKIWPHFWDNSITMWCDKEGGILSIEQSHRYIICVFGNSTEITHSQENILWHANHHQWLDPNSTGGILQTEGFLAQQTYLRSARAREILEDNYGNITLEVCKNLIRDHGGGTNVDKKDSCDICSHPDKNCYARTAFSWIILPKELIVYWAPGGSPCRHLFISCDFTEIFNQN